MKLSPFWQGMASILDIFSTTPSPSLARIKRSVGKTAADAVAQDWAMVYKDLEVARKKFYGHTRTHNI